MPRLTFGAHGRASVQEGGPWERSGAGRWSRCSCGHAHGEVES